MTLAELHALTISVRRRSAANRHLRIWLITGAVIILLLFLREASVVGPAPQQTLLPLSDWISAIMSWFVGHFRGVFRFVAWVLGWPLGWIRTVLIGLPWPAAILIAAGLGFLASGRRLALFCALGLGYIVVTGYWEKTALTLASACVAVPISVALGLLIGILGARLRPARRLIEPILDLMQTIPVFSYLIPILVLFGIGPVVGMTASAIYAIPPMVRNVMLGLERVPLEIVESAIMSGSSRRQCLWWVELPAAMPTILVGINQTVMAGLSMVVIAAMVGGVSDIGLEVFNTMKEAKFGESLLAGLVIAVLAMITDRISRGFAERSRQFSGRRDGFGTRWIPIGLAAGVGAIVILGRWIPTISSYPQAWVFYPADAMNAGLDWFTTVAFPVTSAIKASMLYYLMLPLRIGLAASVRPSYWGFAMSPAVAAIYWILALLSCLGLLRAFGWPAALAGAIAAMFYYFGTTGVPWQVFTLIAVVLAHQTGGWRISLLTALSLLFVVVTGMWPEAMVSVELCAVGVLLSFLIGTGLGIAAALNDRVSAFLRPICDTLQTMPIFVFLIPAIMVFLVGEFTALIALVMYAIVPSIRYTEHGIRTVPAHVVEAARAFGSTRSQRLWQVELPLALPEIMLGLNQTIMMGLAMVVVAALVGARGLGQEVMVALNQANTGTGIVSGLSVALFAIVSDRIIQSWSLDRKRALGLA